MFLLSLIRRLYKVLSADASPSAIAFAVSLGILAGSVPVRCGLAVLIGLAVIVLRVQISAAILAWGLVRLASAALLARSFETLGEALLEAESLRGFWTWFLNLPVVAWLGLERYAILGGAVVGFAAGIAAFVPVRLAVISYRRWLHDRVSKNRFFRWLTNLWLVKAVRFILVGGRA